MTGFSTRDELARHLGALLPGRNLHDLAPGYKVAVTIDGRLNKGWVGQTLERVANLPVDNRALPDGGDFELKSTSLLPGVDGGFRPKETIKITMLNPDRMLGEEFESSALWAKLARLVVVGCHHETPDVCRVVRVSTFDLTDPELVAGVRNFWQEIRLTLALGELPDLITSRGTSDGWIQLRGSGTGKENSRCPISGRRYPSQAFYGTKRLVARVLGL